MRIAVAFLYIERDGVDKRSPIAPFGCRMMLGFVKRYTGGGHVEERVGVGDAQFTKQ